MDNRASRAGHSTPPPPPPPLAVTVTVSFGAGAAATSIVTAALASPADPVQARLNVDGFEIPAICSLPARLFEPFQSPDAVQPVAWLAVHVSCVAPP